MGNFFGKETKKIMFVIVKEITNQNGVKINVILVDSQSEIWEFETYLEADRMMKIFQSNSDSGHKYHVKQIGKQ